MNNQSRYYAKARGFGVPARGRDVRPLPPEAAHTLVAAPGPEDPAPPLAAGGGKVAAPGPEDPAPPLAAGGGKVAEG